MIPVLPMAQPVRGWSTLGVTRYLFREGEPTDSCRVLIKALAVCFDDAHGT